MAGTLPDHDRDRDDAAAIEVARQRATAVAVAKGAGLQLGPIISVRDRASFDMIAAGARVTANAPSAPPAPATVSPVMTDVKPRPIETAARQAAVEQARAAEEEVRAAEEQARAAAEAAAQAEAEAATEAARAKLPKVPAAAELRRRATPAMPLARRANSGTAAQADVRANAAVEPLRTSWPDRKRRPTPVFRHPGLSRLSVDPFRDAIMNGRFRHQRTGPTFPQAAECQKPTSKWAHENRLCARILKRLLGS